MPTHNSKEDFLQDVTSHVKFIFDRKRIYNELDNHIEDRVEDFIAEGFLKEEATSKAIEVMGNATDIGKELNKVHNPFIGWIWKVSDIVLKVTLFFVVFNLLTLLFGSFDSHNPINNLEKSEIVYHYEVDEKATIDNRVIHITDIAYDVDGNLYIVFKNYSNRFLINTWSFGRIGDITDEFGNKYSGGGGSSGGGFVSHSYISLDDYPENSNSVHIVYDNFNRYYEFNFDLEVGEFYE